MNGGPVRLIFFRSYKEPTIISNRIYDLFICIIFKIKVILLCPVLLSVASVCVLRLSLVGCAVQHLLFKTRQVYHLHAVNGASGGDVSGRGSEGVTDV